ncbi:MAG: sulfatase-like hydrolase/transferase, partial [Bacteroidaceae bacterium]|nr:sulfatase-like hydrolase/transferase [Bacteroidaceae bacterium]
MNRCAFLLASLAAGAASAQERPNVIFLVADDLGYGDLKCYGAKNVETPNSDRLAAEGLRFSQCHAAAATSTPSRYSLLTGEYAWRKPGTGVLPGNAGMIIGAEQYTVADLFHDAGYATAAIGKWHLGLGRQAGAQDWNGRLDLT